MPTEAEIQTAIGSAVKILEDLEDHASDNPINFIAAEQTLRGDIQTNSKFASDQELAIATIRGSLSSTIGLGRNLLAPFWREYGDVLVLPETAVSEIQERIFVDFAENAKTVRSRAFVYNPISFTAGGAGNGDTYRLRRDRYNFDIEAGHAESKRSRCIEDQHSGSPPHQELFEFRGDAAFPDLLNHLGSGAATTIRALSAADSKDFLRNPSFDELDGTLALPNSIPGWTVAGAVTNFELDESTTYRGHEGDGGTPRSVKFKADDSLTQSFDSVRLTVRNLARPMFFQVAINKGTATAGTITVTVGAISRAVTVISLSAGWNKITVPADFDTDGDDCWYRIFGDAAAPEVKIEVTGLTGEFFVDDLIFAPFSSFDHVWYAVVGGTVKFRVEDEFTWSHTVTAFGVNQRWFFKTDGFYLPHSATPTWTDPP